MKRRLNSDERELWRRLTETVRPRLRISRMQADLPPEPEKAKPADAARTAKPRPAAASLRPESGQPPPHALEARMRRRLSRGNLDVDARLDLHGMTQERAHRALRLFLEAGRARGHRVVLIITGKGGGEARGILRRAVPLWFAEPGFRDLVAGFEPASRRHGGEGALYVRLRRLRD